MNKDQLFDLSGRVALITGASSRGIGSASARLLAQYGAKVFLVARREEKLSAMAQQIRSEGGEAAWYAGDVSREEDCKAAVEECLKAFGRLDIMLLAAGISGKYPKTMDDMFDTQAYRQVMGINLDGTFFMVKYGWQECARNGCGSIIMVDSLAGFKAAGHVPYSASKGAVRAWTKLFAKQFAPYGVRVNAIVPGLTDSEMVHPVGMDALFEDKVAPAAQAIPLGRLGTPDDMAAGVLYLAADAASWVTGHCLVIDGGELCG
jgi:NAD(P)-dependent dehydrogenase (short-subunit alcohol dehydrogenase family)